MATLGPCVLILPKEAILNTKAGRCLFKCRRPRCGLGSPVSALCCLVCLFPANTVSFCLSLQLISWNNDICLLKNSSFEKCWAGQTVIILLCIADGLEDICTFQCVIPKAIINNFFAYNDLLVVNLLERKSLTLNTGYLRSLFMRIQHQAKRLLPWRRFSAMWPHGHFLHLLSFGAGAFSGCPVVRCCWQRGTGGCGWT